MRRFLMAVAAAIALLVSTQLTTRPAQAAQISEAAAAGILERSATAPAEYAQWRRGYRRGWYRPRYYGRRFYRPRYYRPRYYRPRYYSRPRYYRPRYFY